MQRELANLEGKLLVKNHSVKLQKWMFKWNKHNMKFLF